MKLRAATCSITLLLLCLSPFAQTDRIYTYEELSTANPDSVFRLDLSKNKFQTVPSDIYKFKNVTEVNLSQNKLTALPDEFYFPNLQVLNLEKNDLDTFSQAICNNTTLKQLLLGKNDIAVVPECIGDLTELTVLDIWFNPIRELPMSLTNLKKLRYMDLRGITFSNDFQKKWTALLPWVKIEFELGCDCAN
jgi:Leucine-rich repeat (LRR) protein